MKAAALPQAGFRADAHWDLRRLCFAALHGIAYDLLLRRGAASYPAGTRQLAELSDSPKASLPSGESTPTEVLRAPQMTTSAIIAWHVNVGFGRY